MNATYRAVGNRIILSVEARNYKDKVVKQLSVLRLKSFGKDRLKVTITAYMPNRRKRDLANIDKVLVDSIEASGLFDNDEQIDDVRYIRGPVAPPGRVHIVIESLSGTTNDTKTNNQNETKKKKRKTQDVNFFIKKGEEVLRALEKKNDQ